MQWQHRTFLACLVLLAKIDDDNFDRWIEHFEERAKLAGWTEEQRVYQLKVHLELDKTFQNQTQRSLTA